jgi:hypothetical protein
MISVATDCNRPSTAWYDSWLLRGVQQICLLAPKELNAGFQRGQVR